MDRHHRHKPSPSELTRLGPSQWALARCGPIPPALPARRPHYIIPGSHWMDPAYYQQFRWTSPFSFGWPVPRTPWPGESETRAFGTGLISSPPPCPPSFRRW